MMCSAHFQQRLKAGTPQISFFAIKIPKLISFPLDIASYLFSILLILMRLSTPVGIGCSIPFDPL